MKHELVVGVWSIVVQEDSSIFHFSQNNQVRGVEPVIFMFFAILHGVWYDNICFPLNFFVFSGFWKFSRNCLTDHQSRQVTHTLLCIVLGSKEEPPDDMNWPSGDACFPTEFSRFLYDPPSDDEHPPGDWS